eukprot:4042510-Amphidinium_carterae.1
MYTAPVADGDTSGIPALMGLCELCQARMVLLPRSKLLKILSGYFDEKDIVFPNGTRTVEMDTAPSGHLLLPFLTKHDGNKRDSKHHCHQHQLLHMV